MNLSSHVILKITLPTIQGLREGGAPRGPGTAIKNPIMYIIC